MNVPVIVGVGEVVNRSTRVEEAFEPRALMLQSIHNALRDTTVPPEGHKTIIDSIEGLHVVNTWTWTYHDLPSLVARDLGADVKFKALSEHAGNSPGALFENATRRVVKGESKMEVVTGGEALASLGACMASKKMPPPGWSPKNTAIPSVMGDSGFEIPDTPSKRYNMSLPTCVYALYENAFRAHRHQSADDNDAESAQLYAEFAKIAAAHPGSRSYGLRPADKDTIQKVSPKNRIINSPYRLLMNAFNTVNMAAACIVTTVENARRLNIPEERWVYPLAAAGTSDPEDYWMRPNYHTSAPLNASLDSAIQTAKLTAEDIDLLDIYSCFPIVPKLAAHHLGLPICDSPKPLTLLGGLTSFGGAGNNYSLHAFVEMTRRLRKGDKHTGLVLANGGVATYQHVTILSRKPPQNITFPTQATLPKYLENKDIPAFDEKATGEAVVETYTVEYGRDGKPRVGCIVGRLAATGHRFLANHADSQTLQDLAAAREEPVGRTGFVHNAADGRNLFSFHSQAKL